MTPQEIERLRFRRQYLLAPYQLGCPFVNNHLSISQNLHLYSHIDLNVSTSESGQRKIILLGDIFDYRYPDYKNEDIIADLINYSFDVLLSKISDYCGRFVVICKENESIKLIHDAAASRKIYYYRNNKGIFCASQPHLLARILNLELSFDRSKLDFYSSEEFEKLHNSNIGNTTCYDEVYQLIPNHFFDLNEFKPKRYWPNHKIDELPVKDVADRCSHIIKGYMKSISNRYPVMLPVTAGKDSRLLLSATYNIRKKVFYYINKGSHLNNKHHDIVIPGKLLHKLNLKFNILDPCIAVDKDFEKVYFENNRFGSISFLPIIYNYYNKFGSLINLPGTFAETACETFHANGRKITAELIANMIGVERFEYAIKYFDKWLSECESLCRENNINIMSLLYWEERMANWGTQIQIDKDIAQEEFMPYNSRLLIETMLMAPLRSRENPDYLMIHEIIRKLWPETLLEPLNSNLKKKALIISKKLGIMRPFKTVYYSVLPKVLHAKKVYSGAVPVQKRRNP